MLITIANTPVLAERLSIARIHADPALSGPSVRGLQMSPDGARVTYLRGRDTDQFRMDLWEFNVRDKLARRLVDSVQLEPLEQLSEAEKAKRERERTASYSGINDYSWAPSGQQLLIQLNGNLYLVDVAKPRVPRKVAIGNVLDAKISPKGRYVSFVRAQNLFVVDLQSGSERQLTQDGGGNVHNAEAEFVAQEEMGQSSGYWWAPDDSAIAFKRFDESPVALVRRFEIQADRADVVEQRYPAAGQPNVLVGLAVVSPSTGVMRAIDLGAQTDIYLVRADWSEDARLLAFQRQSRDQKRLELIAVNVDTLKQHTLLTETSSTWVNVQEPPHFLKKQAAFIWASERSGRNHLYLYDFSGRLLRPLTTGNWGVDGLLSVDEAKGQFFVASNRDANSDKQVYRLSLDGSDADKPRRITTRDGWHDPKFSEGGEAFVDKFSDPDTPPQVSIHQADGTFLAWIERNELNAEHPYAAFKASHVATEFGSIQSVDGQVLHYRLKKPLGFDPTKRYPVFLSTYGGPGAQVVTREWSNLFEQYMAQQGYVVFSLDNRGSARRERRFTDVIYHAMGQPEVVDQLTGIDWLCQQSFVDAKRIGVFGWSYGGFMTLRLLAAASDRIAAGVAGAPVADWALYDTHYTERYLGQPKADGDVYRQSGVLAHLGGVKAPLLLMHGMADDNVLFTNSTQLMNSLQDRGVLFDLMTYPGGKHGLSKPASKKHVHRTIEAFFARHLKAYPPL